MVSDVRLSVEAVPVSDESTRSGAAGEAADVATTNGNAAMFPVLPEISVIAAATDHEPSLKLPRVQDEATPTV